jgi:hyperosmotically inducible protein
MKKITLSTVAVSLALAFGTPLALANTSSTNAIVDTNITQNVQASIAANTTTSSSVINVNTQNGVVKLQGNVKTDAEASAATQIAESTPGVKDVDTSNLTVQDSQQPLTDMYITAKVKGIFLREKVLGDAPLSIANLNVETKNGVVYLTGKVENRTQLKNAIKLAKTIQGVNRVEAKVEVNRAN